jgi:Fungal Zn(2)-Cys(6) binuclear cluster domain
MQSASDELGNFGEDWASLQFDLELTQSTPPPYSPPTPQPRLGPASLRNHELTSDRPRLAMTTNNQPFGQSPSYESADVEDTKQESTPPRDQHRRGYQACDPCRKRKVKCDLGSASTYIQYDHRLTLPTGVDNPHNPPCMRCRREHKDCIFSTTRRKRKPSQEADDASSDGGMGRDKRRLTVSTHPDAQNDNVGYSYSYSASSPFPRNSNLGSHWQSQGPHTSHTSQPRSSNGYDTGMMVDSKPLADGRSSQTLSPRPLAPITSPRTNLRNTNEHMLNKEAANILHPSIATSHEALHLLSMAAGQTEEANRQSSQSLPSHLRSPSTTFGTPSSTGASHRHNFSRNMNSGEQAASGAKYGMANDQPLDAAETKDYQEALQMWSRMRLVKGGWFTAPEAMAYVE